MMKYANVYTADEENSHRFYQLPKELFVNENYRSLSSDAKLLYSLLLDRKELSRSNGWVDKDNQVYLLYSRDHVAEMLCVSRPTVTKAFKQLASCELIVEERQGLNKPNKIYICRLQYSSDAGRKFLLHQEANNVSPNDTEFKETEKIKRYLITETGDEALLYYNDLYRQTFEDDHPTVTETQLERITERVQELRQDFDMDTDVLQDAMEEYFAELPEGNDGKVFAFLAGNGPVGTIYRYVL